MKYLFTFFTLSLFFSITSANEPSTFDTKWIPAKPEVLTYQSSDPNGTGLYQVSLSRKNEVFEVYLNIIYPGFTKTVLGTFDGAMMPIASTSKIIVNGQIVMDTECSYISNQLRISTLMSPYNKTMSQDITLEQHVFDFSQIPILLRTLDLKNEKQFSFTSINPQTNTLVPLTIKVTGEDQIKEMACYKVEVNDFEGQAIYWIEKNNMRRIIRVNQPANKRVTELLP